MEVRYRREMSHNYMIMDVPEQPAGYECRMLAGNQIEGLLKFRIRYGEEKQEFYYEITSRQPLARILEKRKATGEEIRRILVAVMTAARRIEEYLLKEEQILLDPEYIYVEPDRFIVELCLLPGHTCDWPAALSELLKFLLEKADHQDKDGMILAYNLYQESLKENYGAADLLKYLSPAEDRIFAGPEKESAEKSREPEPEGVYRAEKGDKAEIAYEPQGRYGLPGGDEFQGRCESLCGQESNLSCESKNNRENKKQNTEIGKEAVKAILFLAAAEAAIWYLTGVRGLRIYGAAAAGLICFLFLLRMVLKKIVKKKENHKVSSSKTIQTDHTMIMREPAHSESGADNGASLWELRAESEESYQARMQKKAEEEMRKSREEGTVLLNGERDSGSIGVLEPLSRDDEPIEVSYVPFTIGKHPQLTDYCLSRPTVSRLHLRIDKKENVCIITDLKSTNGTAVNDYQLQANETVSIKTGDIIYLADTGFRFREQR